MYYHQWSGELWGTRMLSLEKVTFFCRSFFESGYTFDHKAALNGNILSEMWNKSPIRHVDKVTENVVS